MAEFPWDSVINSVTSLFGNAQQNKYNKELAQYQNAFNLEMWNRNNEYNSPKATIGRLVEAGVNPRAYNNLGQFANAADAPQAASYSKTAPLAAFSDIMLTQAQIENLKSQTEKNNAEIRNKDADTANKSERKKFYEYELNNLVDEVRENRIKHEVWSRERGFSTWQDFDNEFGKKFDEYISDVIRIRKGQGASYEYLNDLRRVQKELQEQEKVNFESIPKQWRWLFEAFIDFVKLAK